MVRTNQGGSMLSFVIVGGVLIALLIGGVYFIRNRASVTVATPSSDQSQTEESAKMATKPDEKEVKSQPDTAKPQPQVSSSSESAARPSELPQTGPAETILAMIGAGLLVGSSTAYYRSRDRRVTL
jgi:LPXTG-motif cell wall-anchored protein